MKRLAVVVQRCGDNVIGGSESYALAAAKVLSRHYDIEILTTTAKDHVTWDNYFPEGDEEVSANLKIKRFRVDIGRSAYWHRLDGLYMGSFPIDFYANTAGAKRERILGAADYMPLSFCEEWIKNEGPYSKQLLEFIRKNNERYSAFIFMTYIYAQTYFGVSEVSDKNKVFIVPTFHNESPAFMPIFKKYKDYHQLFLTGAEKKFAEEVVFKRPLRSSVIGFGLTDRFTPEQDYGKKQEYLLYAGRLEENKGVLELFKFYEYYYANHRKIRLVTIGDGHLKNYRHEGIEYRGYVSEEEKLSLMRNAAAFIHPSRFESFGIVLIESFMMGTPALVNARCEVLREHIALSKAGYSYLDKQEFCGRLDRILAAGAEYDELSLNARSYFKANYSLEAFYGRLKGLIG